MGYFLTFPKLVLSEEGELDGSDRFLWTALERDLNFTSNLTKYGVLLLFTVLTGNFASLSRIGNAGKQSGIGGEWDGLVGELLAGNIDVSMNVMAVRHVSNKKNSRCAKYVERTICFPISALRDPWSWTTAGLSK